MTGRIRDTITGLFIGGLLLASVRPLCWFMVAAHGAIYGGGQ